MPRGMRYNYNDYHKEIDGILYKKCTRHKGFFPDESEWIPCTSEYFYVNKKNKSDGLHPECIRCGREKANRYTQENLEEVLARNEKWKEENRDKNLGYMRDHYQNNKDYRREYVKGWVNENPERAKELMNAHRNHDITKTEWESCKNFFNNSCAYCGLPIEKHTLSRNNKIINMDLHREHVDNEGYNDMRNCSPSCQSCNSTKNEKTLDELFESGLIENFTHERYNKIIQWITEEYKKYIEPKPPYIITRKQNEGLKTYHWELWTVDEYRNMIECIATADKKKGLKKYIKEYFPESL